MEKCSICPICQSAMKIDYACGEYFAHCTDGCAAPACFHSSESSTRLSWEDWAEWYLRNHPAPIEAEKCATPEQKAFALACRMIGRDMWKEVREDLLDTVDSEAVCRVCGCTQNNACIGGCYWVEDDLCSACAAAEHVPTEKAGG